MMQTELLCVHIDLETAISDFMSMLDEQEKDGENNRPSKPENRAIYRELAPFRLLEYSYISSCPDALISGVYFAFADGTTLMVEEDLPESLVDRLVSLQKPAYLYVILNYPQNGKSEEQFLISLAEHLGRSIIGWLPVQGKMVSKCFDGLDWKEHSEVLTKKMVDIEYQPMTIEQLLNSYRSRLQDKDGRCWARVVVNYVQYIISFADAFARDEFIAWSYGVCDAAAVGRYNVGLVCPAEIATKPGDEVPCLSGTAPSAFDPDPRLWAISDAVTDLPAVMAYWDDIVQQAKAIKQWP